MAGDWVKWLTDLCVHSDCAEGWLCRWQGHQLWRPRAHSTCIHLHHDLQQQQLRWRQCQNWDSRRTSQRNTTQHSGSLRLGQWSSDRHSPTVQASAHSCRSWWTATVRSLIQQSNNISTVVDNLHILTTTLDDSRLQTKITLKNRTGKCITIKNTHTMTNNTCITRWDRVC